MACGVKACPQPGADTIGFSRINKNQPCETIILTSRELISLPNLPNLLDPSSSRKHASLRHQPQIIPLRPTARCHRISHHNSPYNLFLRPISLRQCPFRTHLHIHRSLCWRQTSIVRLHRSARPDQSLTVQRYVQFVDRRACQEMD